MSYQVNIELKDLQSFSYMTTANAVLRVEDSSGYCILTMNTQVHSNDVNIGVLDLKRKAASQFRKVLNNTLGAFDNTFPHSSLRISSEEPTAPLRMVASAGFGEQSLSSEENESEERAEEINS